MGSIMTAFFPNTTPILGEATNEVQGGYFPIRSLLKPLQRSCLGVVFYCLAAKYAVTYMVTNHMLLKPRSTVCFS
jgi:hypothetical protein